MTLYWLWVCAWALCILAHTGVHIFKKFIDTEPPSFSRQFLLCMLVYDYVGVCMCACPWLYTYMWKRSEISTVSLNSSPPLIFWNTSFFSWSGAPLPMPGLVSKVLHVQEELCSSLEILLYTLLLPGSSWLLGTPSPVSLSQRKLGLIQQDILAKYLESLIRERHLLGLFDTVSHLEL